MEVWTNHCYSLVCHRLQQSTETGTPSNTAAVSNVQLALHGLWESHCKAAQIEKCLAQRHKAGLLDRICTCVISTLYASLLLNLNLCCVKSKL